MFNENHLTWKAFKQSKDGDALQEYAEHLINEWSYQNQYEVKFRNEVEINIASWLLADDLLPESARRAFGLLMLDTMKEAKDQGIMFRRWGAKKPKLGRKKSTISGKRIYAVMKLVEAGATYTDAYQVIAKAYCKSPCHQQCKTDPLMTI